MVELREPLESSIKGPRTYTQSLKFPDPAKTFLYDDTLCAVERYYADQAQLGVGEEALVGLVLKMKAAQRATTGNRP